jgi:hypothetical protein
MTAVGKNNIKDSLLFAANQSEAKLWVFGNTCFAVLRVKIRFRDLDPSRGEVGSTSLLV